MKMSNQRDDANERQRSPSVKHRLNSFPRAGITVHVSNYGDVWLVPHGCVGLSPAGTAGAVKLDGGADHALLVQTIRDGRQDGYLRLVADVASCLAQRLHTVVDAIALPDGFLLHAVDEHGAEALCRWVRPAGPVEVCRVVGRWPLQRTGDNAPGQAAHASLYGLACVALKEGDHELADTPTYRLRPSVIRDSIARESWDEAIALARASTRLDTFYFTQNGGCSLLSYTARLDSAPECLHAMICGRGASPLQIDSWKCSTPAELSIVSGNHNAVRAYVQAASHPHGLAWWETQGAQLARDCIGPAWSDFVHAQVVCARA